MKEFSKIRTWAKERGIYSSGDSKTQLIKAMEELGEISKALLKQDTPEVIDGVGDVVVVLTNFIELYSREQMIPKVKIEDCIQAAYKEISDRKGKMENGTFIKEDPSNIETVAEEVKQKQLVELEQHLNGYYNLPCKFSEIVEYMKTHDLKMDGKVYTEEDKLHLVARPSRNGGCAYMYV